MTQPTPQWAAERTIEPQQVARWLRALGHHVDQPIELIAQGFDNFIFKYKAQYVRVTRRQIAAPDIHKEVRLLPKLDANLPTRVPRPTIIPHQLEKMDWPWFVFEPVHGREVAELLEQKPRLSHVAQKLGQTLRTLHSPHMLEQVAGCVREDTYRRMDMPHRIAQSRRSIGQLKEMAFELPYDAIENALKDAQGLGVIPNQALVHGDLHMRHLIVDDAANLQGIIDWGDAHIGHPGCDFYPYWSLFNTHCRRIFLECYGPTREETLLGGRVVAIYINAVLALSADDFGLPWLKSAAIEGLIRTVR